MGSEQPIDFTCQGETLIGIVHGVSVASDLGVVVVVGGPQYRTGSHRQFVLLARHLAEAGICTLRFDTRGMGDSSGQFPGFEAINDDIRAAVDAFQAACPHLRRFVLWGLCDAASAISFYAHGDARICGIAVANPWVRTEETYSRTQLKHYYLRRVFNRTFWRAMLSGKVDIVSALGEFLGTVATTVRAGRGDSASKGETGACATVDPDRPLPDRMAQGFAAFSGPALILISGKDLTAREFVESVRDSPMWRPFLDRPDVSRENLEEADHTFSRRDCSDQVAIKTRQFIESIRDRR